MIPSPPLFAAAPASRTSVRAWRRPLAGLALLAAGLGGAGPALAQTPAPIVVGAAPAGGMGVPMAPMMMPAPGLVPRAGLALTDVQVSAPDADRVLVTLTLNGPAPRPLVFTVDKPARLSIDIPDVGLAMLERFKRTRVGRVQSGGAAEAKGRTRVVVELSELAPYQVRVAGNQVMLELGAVPTVAMPQVYPGLGAAGTVGMAAGPAPDGITNVDFRRGDKGEARIVVSLNDARIPVDVTEEGGRVVARFRNTTVPERLLRRLDVLDFATPVKFIDTQRDGVNVRMVVTPAQGAEFEQVAYQSGNTFTLELQPLSPEKAEERRKARPQYVGQKISLNFQSVDVRSLLQIIADVAGVNIVVSDTVTGEVAMRLQNVPWDQALDIILRTKGLGMRQQGNVILVAPLAELAEREKTELENERAKVQLAPLRSEIVQINYAKASDMAALLRSGENSILSDRGRVSVDERTNTLLVLETRDKLNEVRALITRLDVPVRQVLIEARIVIASDDFTKSLGARFGVTGLRANGNNGLAVVSGNTTSNDITVNDFLNTTNNNGARFPVAINGTATSRSNFNNPATSATGSVGSIAFAILGASSLVDLEISALQAEGKGEVVSSPRTVTADRKQSTIEQGVEIPYQQGNGLGVATVAFKKAVLSLTVTPQITPDNQVIMDLAINNDSVGQVVSNSQGGSVPSIDTRKIQTQVLVSNGQTIVLGGIYQTTNTETVTKVPLLGDIPILGAAFRQKANVVQKRELLIFITPKIISEALRVN